MRLLGLGFEDAAPDAKTVWLFREQLTRASAIEELFAAFDAWLKGKGYLAGLPGDVGADHRSLDHRGLA